MKVEWTSRGFQVIKHEARPPDSEGPVRLVQMSSIVGRYDDAFDRPGTSALWIGNDHHLNREEVAEMVEHLSAWLKTGSLELPADVREEGHRG